MSAQNFNFFSKPGKMIVGKPAILLAAALVLAANSYAQKNKWSVAATFGPSFPVGKFGAKSITDSTTAFAKTGLSLNLTLSYQIMYNFGAMLLLGGQQNTSDNKGMEQKMDATNPNAAFYVNRGKWQMGRILAGPYYQLALSKNKKFFLTARLLAGALKTTAPAFTFGGVYEVPGNPNGNATFVGSRDKKSLHWAFAYQAGVGLQYHVTKNIFVKADVDYAGCSPTVPYILTAMSGMSNGPVIITGGTGNPPPVYNPGAYHYKQSLNSVNLCAGIGISF